MICGVILIGLSFIILNLTDWSGILVVGLFLMSIGEMIIFPFSNAYAMERSNFGNKGEYMALYMMAFSIAHIFSHDGGMHLIDSVGFDKTWVIAAILSFGAVILIMALGRLMHIEANNE